MRFITPPAVLLALAASTSALDLSKTSDLDGSVWDNVTPSKGGLGSRAWNRPIKRQSGWSPPSSLATPLKEVWNHCLATYSDGLFGFKNYGWDQIMATSGSINVCVRWESSTVVTEAQRTQVAQAVNKQHQNWFKYLYGFDNFPFSEIKVNIVGWAVKDTSLLQGSTSGIDVYTTTDSGGIPECDPRCGRFFHQDNNYGSCPGGASRHYDNSLWLTDGMSGGAGGDWGQRIGREYFMGALSSENIHILLHEMGHTFGLDDFYDWTPTGVSNFIMLAGSATEITDFDAWMFRQWWYELSRNRGWQTGTSNPSPTTTTTRAGATTTTTRATTPTTSSGSGSGTVPRWGQCGGNGYTGATQCVSPYTCTKQNDWYSQCL
ncbi:hypothetical protein jhhlp_000838 [Lomentospora prolificans]|uniref:CBM1 domain-containing protein n=1 Tax=Lomentospora prolificans TaxID=41688 RepID=A0A2N3NJL1_9PEZI|nr:hypothetical protein jhhlp_000838 [Lomentospora prolificans]